jgi:hypothetical protein
MDLIMTGARFGKRATSSSDAGGVDVDIVPPVDLTRATLHSGNTLWKS